MNVAKRVTQFPEYIHARLAKEVTLIEKQTGRKVLNFGQGSPDFRPSTMYLEKYIEFIKEPQSHMYPGYGSTKEFSNGISAWYKNRFQVELQQDELFPLLGSKDGISHLPLAL